MSTPLKTITCAVILLVNAISSHAQQKAVPPSDEVIKQRLVDLALQGPLYKVTEHQDKINEYQLKKAQSAWLNLLAVSYNVNDQTFAKQSTVGTTNVYPKYTFGVTLPMGIIFSHTEAKSAREQIKAGKATQEELARTIKRDVLTKYAQYKTQELLVINQNRVIDDYTATFLQIEGLFKKEQKSVEEYNAASQAKNTQVAQGLLLQLQLEITKLDLESVIGVPLEDVLSGKAVPATN